jgi:predicted CopG family antitoxin
MRVAAVDVDMGTYDRERFRQIMVGAELYRQLALARSPGESFGEVIRRLIVERGAAGNKKGRSDAELMALARIARRAWERKVASGEVKPLGRRS